MPTIAAFPLQWPAGRQRTRRYAVRRARFCTRTANTQLSIAAALTRLNDALRKLKVTDIVVPTNVPINKGDGQARSLRADPDDRGVAVYLRVDGEAHVLSCDKWDRVADNIAAIAAHVDAIRGQARWGVADLRQTFAGFKALPAMEARKTCWEVLGMKVLADRPRTKAEIEAQYVVLARRLHPDNPGGNAGMMAEINAARDEALLEIEA